jgi:hypothetical protein
MFTVGLFTGTDTGSGLSGLTAIGSTGPQSVNNTSGGNYTNTASIFSIPLTGAAQTTNPIAANTEFIIGITIAAGNSFDLATGVPFGGTPQPTYTFNNAFTGSSGLDTNSYFYSAGNGVVTGSPLSANSNVGEFVDLTATVVPLPEPSLGQYLLFSMPLLIGVILVRRFRSNAAAYR